MFKDNGDGCFVIWNHCLEMLPRLEIIDKKLRFITYLHQNVRLFMLIFMIFLWYFFFVLNLMPFFLRKLCLLSQYFLYLKRQQDNDILDGSSDRQQQVSIRYDVTYKKNSKLMPKLHEWNIKCISVKGFDLFIFLK